MASSLEEGTLAAEVELLVSSRLTARDSPVVLMDDEGLSDLEKCWSSGLISSSSISTSPVSLSIMPSLVTCTNLLSSVIAAMHTVRIDLATISVAFCLCLGRGGSPRMVSWVLLFPDPGGP